MKKRRRLQTIRNKGKKLSIRNPIAPPSIRHSALKGTGYNRLKEKEKFNEEIRDFK